MELNIDPQKTKIYYKHDTENTSWCINRDDIVLSHEELADKERLLEEIRSLCNELGEICLNRIYRGIWPPKMKISKKETDEELIKRANKTFTEIEGKFQEMFAKVEYHNLSYIRPKDEYEEEEDED